MSILSLPVRPVPLPSPDPSPILTVRVTFLTPHAATRKHTFVRVERRANEGDDALFLKAIDEYRRLHGYTCRVVALDLKPNE